MYGINQNTNVTYYYNNQELKTTSSVILATGAKPAEVILEEREQARGETIQQENGLKAEIIPISANNIIKDGEEINEGQPVSYTVKITNTMGRDLNDFKLVAEHTNVVYYEETETEGPRTDNPQPEVVIKTEQNENLKEITKTIGTLKDGETATITYQFVPKKRNGDEITGKIRISANNMEEQEISTIRNKIKDAQIAIEVLNGLDEKVELNEGSILSFQFNITNNSRKQQKDILLNMQKSEILKLMAEEEEVSYEDLGIEIIENKEDKIMVKIPTLEAEQTKTFNLIFQCGKLPEKVESDDFTIYYTAQLDNETYYSNTLIRPVKRVKAKLSAIQKSNKQEGTVTIGDKIIYTADIKNEDEILDAKDMKITHMVTEGNSKIDRAYLQKDGEIIEAGINKNSQAVASYNLKAGETIQYVAEVSVYDNVEEGINYEDNVTSEMSLAWELAGALDLNEVKTPIKEEKEISYEEDNDNDEYEEYDEEESNTNPSNTNGTKTNNNSSNSKEVYSISGLAWLDKNRNGIKDSNEDKISGIEVQLLNANNGTIVMNKNNQQAITFTDSDGTYRFNEIPSGNYMVIFKYDSDIYSITQYKKENTAQDKNSDVIQKTLQGQTVAITDKITINNNNITNIDAGLTENTKFDFSLNKTINRIIVQNQEGVRTTECEGSKLAKAEINAKYADNTTVLVEYNIEVKNEGEISGYVNDIIDYMPKDLKFSSEINKEWNTDSEGNLHNVSLSNTSIKPGESKKVTLTLTKAMTGQNTGMSVNIAEIGQATNELSVEDTDSTPGNRRDGEDDISTAELLTSIKTGSGTTITISIILIIVLIGISIVIYRKREGGK